MTDADDFAQRTEPFRRELLAHCYRMLGSVDDAEDLVQDTYLRAWRAFDRFEGRSSLRAWLYRIATNACLSVLTRRPRRWLPSDAVPPVADVDALAALEGPPPSTKYAWVGPIPDQMVGPLPEALVAPSSEDPASVVAQHSALRLAFVASLQYLPPRQRAVLLLREVLDFPAAQVAEALGTTTPAVKSSLQRARARMHEVAPSLDEVREPTDAQARAQLEAYVAAFERSDARVFEQLLCDEAVLETMPAPTWFDGRRACLSTIRAVMYSPGDWRMLPIRANTQPAVATYLRGPDGQHHAFGVAMLTLSPAGIARITLWGEPRLVSRFGLPPLLSA